MFLLFSFPHYRDRASHNDVIGTANLCMSKISAPGGEIDGELLAETGLKWTEPDQFGLDWFREEWTEFECLSLTRLVCFVS